MALKLEKVKKRKHASESGSKDKSNWQVVFGKMFAKKLSVKKKERFFNELAMLSNAGMDMNTALQIIVGQQTKEFDRKLFSKLHQSVQKGSAFAEAIKNLDTFSEYDFFSLQAGEESGRLNTVLQRMSDFYSRNIKFKRKIVNAISYPTLVLVITFFTVFFMLNYLIPMFTDVFVQTNAELPAITKFVVRLSEFFNAWFHLFGLILLLIVILSLLIRRNEYFRQSISRLILRLPFIGSFVKLVVYERFLIFMVLLLEAGIPIISSLGLVQKVVRDYSFEKAIANVREKISKGISLHRSMEETRLFEPRMISLIKIGEEVNQLPESFEKLKDQYSGELEYKVNNMNSILEPLLIIIVGGIVAFFLISMYLPIFRIGAGFGI